MSDPLSQQIIDALIERLSRVRTSNGFRTDAGEVVRHGRLKTDSGKLHLAIFGAAAKETEDPGRNRISVAFQVEIAASAPPPESDEAGRYVELVIADIQEAVEVEKGRTLGGIATGLTPLGRAKLAPIEGSKNQFTSLTYMVSYHRLYGSPDRRV